MSTVCAEFLCYLLIPEKLSINSLKKDYNIILVYVIYTETRRVCLFIFLLSKEYVTVRILSWSREFFFCFFLFFFNGKVVSEILFFWLFSFV